MTKKPKETIEKEETKKGKLLLICKHWGGKSPQSMWIQSQTAPSIYCVVNIIAMNVNGDLIGLFPLFSRIHR